MTKPELVKKVNRNFFYLQELVDTFNLIILSGKSKLSKKIRTFGINRPGLELADFYVTNRNQRVCIIGGKESIFLSRFTKDVIIERLSKLIGNLGSILIITANFKYKKELIDICSKFDFPLCQTTLSSTEFLIELVPWISRRLSNRIEVHASLMSVYGEGVLIKGVSGVGKSEICMALLSRNHFFIGDDRIILYRTAGDLYGACAPIIKNMIEIRGVGLLDVEKVFGAYKVLDESKISCIINLKTPNKSETESLRLNYNQKVTNILGIKIPTATIPVLPGRSIPLLIEAAVINFKMQKKGINFIQELDNRFLKFSNDNKIDKDN